MHTQVPTQRAPWTFSHRSEGFLDSKRNSSYLQTADVDTCTEELTEKVSVLFVCEELTARSSSSKASQDSQPVTQSVDPVIRQG